MFAKSILLPILVTFCLIGKSSALSWICDDLVDKIKDIKIMIPKSPKGQIIEVTSDPDLEDQLQKAANKLVMIDFAEYKRIEKSLVRMSLLRGHLQNLLEKYPGLVILKVDKDKCKNAVESRDLKSFPAFVFVHKGNENKKNWVTTHLGIITIDTMNDIEKKLNSLFL